MQTLPQNQYGPAIMQGGGQPIYVVVQNRVPNPKSNAVPKTAVIVISALQLIAALLAAAVQIGLIFMDYKTEYYSLIGVGYIGTGIWCGAFFGVSAIIGIVSACWPSKSSNVWFLVMSIISFCLCIPMIVISSVGITESYTWVYGYYPSYNSYRNPNHVEQLALNSVQISIAILVSGFGIASTVLSSRALCCQSNRLPQGGMMQMAPPPVGMQYIQQGQMVQSAMPMPQYNGGYVTSQPGPGLYFQNVPVNQMQSNPSNQGPPREPPIYSRVTEENEESQRPSKP